ncbi:type I phosphomannose isomerase catalytic subunit [Pelagerythrobacter aerophilus]|uniref:Mannose-6-phosphate isomerase n=1 Tax=Pelagerythrobacter aerophilus TaxID=2306995 RepID=A0A418NF62_9SPHN|nr:type I phosphomannose isomerase catalytic subunit [Pelagerythrobacter aerophilus]RIV75946.1 mannose-6-phosphate isomerase [Pelagerythrobacter aerophilus]
MKLVARHVEKPWGRTSLPIPIDGHEGGERIGEIWFTRDDAQPMPLLVKLLFTSERLSIQVHPDDEQARDRGLAAGKTECWYVTAAEPGAVLGIGTREPLDGERLRALALDGGIEAMMDWKPVQPGDFFLIPAGTVHAIGAGVSLVEVQQNSDVTYRLYDYGRPRELHLDDGVAVARAEPYADDLFLRTGDSQADCRILVSNRHFTVAKGVDASAIMAGLGSGPVWMVPLEGEVTCGADRAGVGECLLVEGEEPRFAPGTEVLAAGRPG